MKKLYFLVLAFSLFNAASAQIINFPDNNFKAKLLAASPSNSIAKNLLGNYFKIDANSDGEIQETEASEVSYLRVDYSNIVNFQGISYFTNLEIFDCHNNSMTTLNLSGMTSLRLLYCYNSFLSSLNLTGLTNLIGLNCSNSNLGTLDLSGLPSITDVDCTQSQLTSLNLSGLTNLNYLQCGTNLLTTLDVSNLNLTRLESQGNQITALDLSHSTNLQYLNCTGNNLTTLNLNGVTAIYTLLCGDNHLTSLNIAGMTNLIELSCYYNSITTLATNNLPNLQKLDCAQTQIATLDVSNSPALLQLNCSQNPLLASLFIKNGSNEASSLNFGTNPSLRYICADESQLTAVQTKITNYGLTNCFVSSYCSFVPGGPYYTIQGNSKFDSNANGCDVADISLFGQKFSITSGATTGSLISNNSGNYSIPVVTGTHTIMPVFENPAYFIASPASRTVNFPSEASPAIQNFCMIANGVHPDLEITLLPLNRARPGFDAGYTLVYKNKGNQTQSGSVNLAFNDAVLDFVSAIPVVTSQTVNNLSWDFTNLQPFETREITLTLNVNSPMETPAVNGGDVLNYTATIASAATDETPNDNAFTLNQTVVNSFDPNDKTCLEGTTIAPSEVGKYVHYVIRFENTGTYPAENIVVKDMIDTAKFDVSTLVPIKGSHDFFTRIDGNKVEFIFENINLPFDDANNDGYVAFKIKTKPTLVNGDTFSNSASIYFDYNFPIVTNTATTTIQALSTQDFEFTHYFNVYPNPVNTVLNIDAKQTIEVSSISIYNQLGQLVLVIPNAQNTKTVDVSRLASGNYFIKINSDKGTSNAKFVKR